jgi:hypothetical protein
LSPPPLLPLSPPAAWTRLARGRSPPSARRARAAGCPLRSLLAALLHAVGDFVAVGSTQRLPPMGLDSSRGNFDRLKAIVPSTVATGTPGFMDFRVVPLPALFTYSCTNTSQGPSITLWCNGCRIPPRDHYVSW